MDSDDRPTGRLLTRRDLVALLGVSGAALATGVGFAPPRGRARGTPLPPCVARPEQTEGPYFVDEGLTRADIRTDPTTGIAVPGTELALTFLVSRVGPGRCDPLPGALVDIWQCDAGGIYSDVVDPRFNTVGQKFLRGNQTTDTDGSVRFQTIYPGWYQGRAVHIHFKIRAAAGGGRTADFTSQVYFDEAITDRVYQAEHYGGAGRDRTKNAADRIFQRGGEQLLLTPRPVAGGYEAEFAVGLQLD